jgi:hypothetical protein
MIRDNYLPEWLRRLPPYDILSPESRPLSDGDFELGYAQYMNMLSSMDDSPPMES